MKMPGSRKIATVQDGCFPLNREVNFRRPGSFGSGGAPGAGPGSRSAAVGTAADPSPGCSALIMFWASSSWSDHWCSEISRLELERPLRRPPAIAVSYTHLRAHETKANLVCRLL